MYNGITNIWRGFLECNQEVRIERKNKKSKELY